ncbi:MAG: HYR domain-containing protein [Saprospiraceae bacterium]|nr:HYR domain-containing protein [Saprospiraceae bacterium]
MIFSQVTFQKTFGGSGQETGTYVLETSNGFLVVGHTTNATGNQDGLLLRLDIHGTTLWQKRFGGGHADQLTAAVATTDGGFVAVGETRSFGAESSDIMVVKVDASGNSLWNRIITSGQTDDHTRSLVLMPDGGFMVSGVAFPVGATNNAQTLLVRLNSEGNTLWSKTYSSAAGNILHGNLVKGNTLYASGGVDGEAALARIDLATGNILGTQLYSGAGSEALYYLQPTQDEHLLMADHTWSAATGTDVKVWVQKANPSTGQVLWSKVYYRPGNNLSGRIEKVNDGAFLLTPSDNNNSSAGDAILAKIDGNGQLLWSYQYGNGDADRILKAVQTSDGGFIAVGDIKTSPGNTDILMIKTDANGFIQGQCPRGSGILSANHTASSLQGSLGLADWQQTATANILPMPISLVSQNINTSPAPVQVKTVPLCPDETYTIKGASFHAPKMITDTVQGITGCDTVVQYNLTLSPYVSGLRVIGLCAGETYNIDGVPYMAPATVVDTIPAISGGCDTLRTVVLKVWAQPAIAQTIYFCEGESIMIGGQIYSQPGTVQVTVSSFNGCDTILTYTLVQRPKPTRTVTISFCPGESVMIAGQTYHQAGTVVSYLPSTTGGCDTMVTYTLQERPQPVKEIIHRFCPGESITIAGHTYQQPGFIIETIPSTSIGGDTLVTHRLELTPQVSRSETRGFCPGETVLIAGQTFTQPGTFTVNLPSLNGGCDTIVHFTLELKPQVTRIESRDFCPGETITIAGQAYQQPGTFTRNYPSTNGGCDTIVTYTLQYLTPAPSNIAIRCPNDITVNTQSGSASPVIQYAEPATASDCICPGLELTRTGGPASGTAFTPGLTQVCFVARDQCGQEKPCCFTVEVREEDPCDVKDNGCVKYELLNITADNEKNHTYRVRVTNNCTSKLVYTAIQMPDGMVALEPLNNTIYASVEGRPYIVRSPNFTPMYSIRFKSTSDSLANGQSDIFQFTLPAQADVTFLNITSRLANQSFFEAHLNTFNCPVGVTPQATRPSQSRDINQQISELNSLLLYPNPTSGVLFADLSDWAGQKVRINVLNGQGLSVYLANEQANEELLRMELPHYLTNGIYFLEIASEKGEKEVLRFMLQR